MLQINKQPLQTSTVIEVLTLADDQILLTLVVLIPMTEVSLCLVVLCITSAFWLIYC